MTDLELRRNIMAALEFEPSIDASHIGVAVENGVVTLSGHVRNYAEKLAAERVVQAVKGVRGVAQEIEVRYSGEKQTSDDEIAKRALSIIAWDATVPDDKVKVVVSSGFVTLSGEVEWNYQKTAAETAVRKLSGVRGVSNMITVRPSASTFDIKRRVEDALKRNAEIEASGIRVDVSGGRVTLEGRVHSWHERNVAERAAWAASGVSMVEDRIAIS